MTFALWKNCLKVWGLGWKEVYAHRIRRVLMKVKDIHQIALILKTSAWKLKLNSRQKVSYVENSLRSACFAANHSSVDTWFTVLDWSCDVVVTSIVNFLPEDQIGKTMSLRRVLVLSNNGEGSSNGFQCVDLRFWKTKSRMPSCHQNWLPPPPQLSEWSP